MISQAAKTMKKTSTPVASARTTNTKSATTAKPADDKVMEKILRRRLQYKIHQRRHRAKTKEKTAMLEEDVAALHREILGLQERRRCLQQHNGLGACNVNADVAKHTVREYFRLFVDGNGCAEQLRIQEQIIQSIMSVRLEGSPFSCADETVKELSRSYESYFSSTWYEPCTFDVRPVADMTIVVVDALLHLRPSRDGLLVLFPSLMGQEELVQHTIGSVLTVPGKYTFMFDVSGNVSWFEADLDFVTGLKRLLGSLDRVATFMAGAKLSFGGASQIGCSAKSVADQRYSVSFLLT